MQPGAYSRSFTQGCGFAAPADGQSCTKRCSGIIVYGKGLQCTALYFPHLSISLKPFADYQMFLHNGYFFKEEINIYVQAQSTSLTMNWAWLHVHTYSAWVGVCCRVRGKLIVFAGRIKRAGWLEQSWRGQRAAGLGCQIHLLTMMNHHSNSRPINGFSQWLNTGHL